MHSVSLGLRRALAVAVLAAAAVFATASTASALDEPRVPENVGKYISTGLIPRLMDLFGAKAGAPVVFAATAKVGGVHRVLVFTKTFLSGAMTDEPTQITNTWVAPVTAADGTIAGVASVWINPASDQPELADFSSGSSLAIALAAAPAGTLLLRDDIHSAWFATDGATLTPLVRGTSGVTSPTTPDAYQRTSTRAATVSAEAPSNRGLLVAVIVLGIVVVLLAIFVLLPDHRRRARAKGAAPEPATTPAVSPEIVTEIVPSSRPGPKTATAKPAGAKPAGAKSAGAKPAGAKPATAKRPPASGLSS
jgi:hypothetical protein